MSIQSLTAAALAVLLAAGSAYAQAPAPKAAAPKTPAPKTPAPKTPAPKTAPPAAPASTSPSQAQIDALMDPAVEGHLKDVTAAMQGATTMSSMRGRLAGGARQTFSIDATQGQYFVAAVCDDACADINLRMFGADGKEVFVDDGPDKFPLTQAQVSGNVRFQVELSMKTCSKDPCAYAVRIFRK